MLSSRVTRQIALVAGAAAIVGSGMLTACAKEKPAETKPSSSTSAPVVSETEKAPGSFAPPVKAKAAPTALPGNERAGEPGNVKTGN